MSGSYFVYILASRRNGTLYVAREDPGQGLHGTAPDDIALRDSCAGSRVSFRSAKRPRCTRPGHEGEVTLRVVETVSAWLAEQQL
jgi:hypothetical protein